MSAGSSHPLVLPKTQTPPSNASSTALTLSLHAQNEAALPRSINTVFLSIFSFFLLSFLNSRFFCISSLLLFVFVSSLLNHTLTWQLSWNSVTKPLFRRSNTSACKQIHQKLVKASTSFLSLSLSLTNALSHTPTRNADWGFSGSFSCSLRV